MPRCRHRHLTLLAPSGKRLKCRHCHLTLKPDELEGGYCPECFEVDGKRRYDFDEIVGADTGLTRYRCEACGLVVNA